MHVACGLKSAAGGRSSNLYSGDTMLSSIDKAIEDIRQGRMVILVDDEDRRTKVI